MVAYKRVVESPKISKIRDVLFRVFNPVTVRIRSCLFNYSRGNSFTRALGARVSELKSFQEKQRRQNLALSWLRTGKFDEESPAVLGIQGNKEDSRIRECLEKHRYRAGRRA